MVKQYEIYWVNLDPTVGSKIKKVRPGLVISPNASNKYLNTVIIAPLTSTKKNFPMRLDIELDGKSGQIALDQIRSVDKMRLSGKVGCLRSGEIKLIKQLLKEYLVD